MKDTRKAQEALEGFIDQFGLMTVLDVLRDVCHDKAEHLRSNWQDERTAKKWEQAAKQIERASLSTPS